MDIVRWKFLLRTKVIAEANLIEGFVAPLHIQPIQWRWCGGGSHNAHIVVSANITCERTVWWLQIRKWYEFHLRTSTIEANLRSSSCHTHTWHVVYSLLKVYSLHLHAWRTHFALISCQIDWVFFDSVVTHIDGFSQVHQRKKGTFKLQFLFFSSQNQINFVFTFAFEFGS